MSHHGSDLLTRGTSRRKLSEIPRGGVHEGRPDDHRPGKADGCKHLTGRPEAAPLGMANFQFFEHTYERQSQLESSLRLSSLINL